MASQQPSKLVPWMIYLYIWALFVALPVILYVRHSSDPAALPIDWSLHGMVPAEAGAPLNLLLYFLGFGAYFVAAVAPALMRARLPADAAAGRKLVPYIVRLTAIETSVLVGFVLALIRDKPLAIAPFVFFGALALVVARPPAE